MMNVIYIGTDTWRTDHIGCYGNAAIATPNLDRLASEGVRFTNSYCDGMPTIPMRRVFHTGKSILDAAHRLLRIDALYVLVRYGLVPPA